MQQERRLSQTDRMYTPVRLILWQVFGDENLNNACLIPVQRCTDKIGHVERSDINKSRRLVCSSIRRRRTVCSISTSWRYR